MYLPGIPILRTCLFITVLSSFFNSICTAETNQLSSNGFGVGFFGSDYQNENKSFEISENCYKQLQILENAIKRKDPQTFQFPDAWAKIPSGILYGNKVDMGNFGECLSINLSFEDNSIIQGKYCLAQLQITEKQQANLSAPNTALYLDLGICMPMACKAHEIQLVLNEYFTQKLNSSRLNGSFTVSENKCTTNVREPFKILDCVAVGVLILLGTLLIAGTSYECIARQQGKLPHNLLSAFSIRKNLSQLMQLTPASETPNHIIPCLHGIRVLSTIAIVFVHTFMMLTTSPNINNAEVVLWQQTVFYMVWKNSNYAVDSFFFLTGLLLSFLAFRKMEKNLGKLNIPQMYLHRFIRLSPSLYLAVLLYMTLFRYTGNGPIWDSFISSYQLCEHSWWSTLLYVHNYAAVGEMCLGHTWYLAADTQLYIISPLLLILIWRWRRWGVAILFCAGLSLIVWLFGIIVFYEIIVFDPKSEGLQNSMIFLKIYISTHFRASPWIIGIIFGYYLYTRKGRRIVLSKRLIFLGWLVAMALFSIVIFSLYPKTQPGAKKITPLEGAFYLPLSRVAWSLGLCWIVFACMNGYAGPINDFLSWIFWQPLSKLSYSIYIWHFLVVSTNAGQIKTISYFSNYDGFLRFWGDFGITLIVSIITYLAIEAPMLSIDEFLLSKIATKSSKDKGPVSISQQNLCD